MAANAQVWPVGAAGSAAGCRYPQPMRNVFLVRGIVAIVLLVALIIWLLASGSLG